MSQELIRVPFHGDVIEATKDEKGVWASLRRMCESLGLDPDSQRQKLQKRPWSNTVMMAVMDKTGRKFEMTMLHLDSVPMWLATIETSRVKVEIRTKLELYQKEAAKVLADHFLDRRPARSDFAFGDDLREVIKLELRSCLQEFRQKQIEPRYTLRERLEALGWHSPSERQRRQVRELVLAKLRRAGFPHPERDGLSPASELLFPASQCFLIDEAIEQVWSEATYRERGGMFEPRA